MCFTLLKPKEGIHQFRMDSDDNINGVSNLTWSHVRGNILAEATRRTKALGLFLDNNPSFLSQYHTGHNRVKMLAARTIIQARQSYSTEDAEVVEAFTRADRAVASIYTDKPRPSPTSSILNGTRELSDSDSGESWGVTSYRDSQGNSSAGDTSEDEGEGQEPQFPTILHDNTQDIE